MPKSISPQLATLVKLPPTGKEWCYEIKYDGFRLLAFINNKTIKLMTRNKNDWSEKFPAIIKQLAKIKTDSAIFDGELVALDKKGISRFQLLQNAISFEKKANIAYYIFDILYYKGQDLRNLPFTERKSILKKILAGSTQSLIQQSQVFQGNPKALLKSACKKGFEGLIAKKIVSVYEEKRSKTWLKLKCKHEQEFVIAGFTKPTGKRQYFGSLLIGYFDTKKRLHYAGRVGTGFDQDALKDIYQKMQKLMINKTAFYQPENIPEVRNVTWVKPILVGEVEFTEWTEDNRLRHPAFKGVRLDKKASAVRKEVPTT